MQPLHVPLFCRPLLLLPVVTALEIFTQTTGCADCAVTVFANVKRNPRHTNRNRTLTARTRICSPSKWFIVIVVSRCNGVDGRQEVRHQRTIYRYRGDVHQKPVFTHTVRERPPAV